MKPNRVTILPEFGGSGLTVISDYCGDPKCADGLTYDEMLGTIARLFCPTDSDGRPFRYCGKTLFLTPPEPKHPDAAGDAAPNAINQGWPHLSHWHTCTDRTIRAKVAPGHTIDEGTADAVRLCLLKQTTVYLEFNSKLITLAPDEIVSKALGENQP